MNEILPVWSALQCNSITEAKILGEMNPCIQLIKDRFRRKKYTDLFLSSHSLNDKYRQKKTEELLWPFESEYRISIKYIRRFIQACFLVVILSIIVDSCSLFTHTYQGHFIGTMRLTQYQWHSKASALWLFRKIYCCIWGCWVSIITYCEFVCASVARNVKSDF